MTPIGTLPRLGTWCLALGLWVAAFVWAPLAYGQAAIPGQRLKEPELKALMGSKWKGGDGEGIAFTEVTTQSDGSAKLINYRDGATTEDAGQYTIRNDELCARWNKIRGGREQCFVLYLHQGRHIWVRDGAIIFTSRIVP